MQPEIIVLGVAVVAEAAVIGGVLTGLMRLRARLSSLASDRPDTSRRTPDNVAAASGHMVGDDGTGVLMMEQLDAFVAETELLGEALVSKLEERLTRYETALAGATDGAMLSYGGASVKSALVPIDDAPVSVDDVPEGMAGGAPVGMAEGAPVGMAEDAPEEDPVYIGSWDEFDIQTAREKGMDPLGVALKRGLSTRGAREDKARA